LVEFDANLVCANPPDDSARRIGTGEGQDDKLTDPHALARRYEIATMGRNISDLDQVETSLARGQLGRDTRRRAILAPS